MNEKAELLASFFDKKTVAVLNSVLRQKDTFGVREIARSASVSVATTYRILQKLISIKLVSKGAHGKLAYYSVNKKAPLLDSVYSIVVGTRPSPIDLFKERVVAADSKASFHVTKDASGEEKVFVISNTLSLEKAGEIAGLVETETGKALKYVVLALEQFKQMRDMGIVK